MKNEVRLIDANALEKDMRAYADNKAYCGHIELANGIVKGVGRIDLAPTIDPESLRPKGRWAAINADCRGYANAFECSNCETISHTHTYMKECEFEYCPVCGAKMGGEADD